MSGLNLKLQTWNDKPHFTKIISQTVIHQTWQMWFDTCCGVAILLNSAAMGSYQNNHPPIVKWKSFHKMTKSPQTHRSIHKNNSAFWPFIGCEASFKDCLAICTFIQLLWYQTHKPSNAWQWAIGRPFVQHSDI